MQVLLTDIELDIQELKCLMDAFTREPNLALREVIRRNILQMKGRLETLLLNLDAAVPAQMQAAVVQPAVQEVVVVEPTTDEEPTVQEPTVQEPILPTPVVDFVQPIAEKSEATAVPILGERIKTAVDLCRSISLNDSFRFSRELFNGDAEQMNRTLQQIGEMSTYAAATSFLTAKVKVEPENEAMTDLLELLKKYFN